MGNCVSDLRKEVEKMNHEMLHRLKKAGEYQKKAVYALFPEKMRGHLEVIEKEIKIMLMEIAADVMNECKRNDSSEEKQNHEEASSVKKVDIL